MTIQLINFENLTFVDGTVLTNANLGVTSDSPIQPTTGNRWVWDAASHEPRRTLDAVGGNYIRDDNVATDVRVAQLRWFYWPGADPAVAEYPCVIRSVNPEDGQRAGLVVHTNGQLKVIYNSATQGNVIYDMSALAAGLYAVEYQANCLASGGSIKGWLYSEDLATQYGVNENTGLAFTASTQMGRFRYGGFVASGAWTQDRLAHGIVNMVNEALVDNMLRDAWLAALSSPPTLTVTRPAENMVDARTSTPGTAGILTYAMAYVSGSDHSSGIVQLTDGLFVIPQDTSSSSTYSVTVTENPSSLTDTTDIVVAAASTAVDSIRHRVWTGSGWE